jgi:hypothetical protein
LNDRLALGYKAMIFDLIEGGVGHDRVNEVVKGSIAAARTLAREAEDGLRREEWVQVRRIPSLNTPHRAPY